LPDFLTLEEVLRGIRHVKAGNVFTLASRSGAPAATRCGAAAPVQCA
jgi:hypothetical protein